MQTFLPVPSFALSAHFLDRQRLGKQRVEALQILRTLQGKSSGWANHPAVRMWRGHEQALALYGWFMCTEWLRRGYVDNCRAEFATATLLVEPGMSTPPSAPPWFGDEAFHLSHRSNLVRKMPEHYRRFWPDVPDDLPYVWP